MAALYHGEKKPRREPRLSLSSQIEKAETLPCPPAISPWTLVQVQRGFYSHRKAPGSLGGRRGLSKADRLTLSLHPWWVGLSVNALIQGAH